MDDTCIIVSQEFGEDLGMKSKAFVNSIGAVGVSLIIFLGEMGWFSCHLIICFFWGPIPVGCGLCSSLSLYKLPHLIFLIIVIHRLEWLTLLLRGKMIV